MFDQKKVLGRINLETEVLPLLSTQKRQAGGREGGEVKEEESFGFFTHLNPLPSHLQGLDACWGNQRVEYCRNFMFEAERFLCDTESGLASADPAYRKILAGEIVFRINFLLHTDFITGKMVFQINLV